MQINGFLENPWYGTTCPLASSFCFPPDAADTTVVAPVVMVVWGNFSECECIALWGLGYGTPCWRGTIPRGIAPPDEWPPFLGVEEVEATAERWTLIAACCAVNKYIWLDIVEF